MTLITDTKTLEAFCQRQTGATFLTVDTEFMRESTFWPILCLMQVGGPDEAAAIDALAPGIDLDPLFDLLFDEKIIKVFHAARQDLEIFYHLKGRLPAPLFDTQVAAMVCGFGEQVGYETLIAKTSKARIDKSSRFTDWSLRPLNERQIHYAISDVTHLRQAYEKLTHKLSASGREKWIEEEMAILESPDTYSLHPEKAFRRIKAKGAKPRFLAILREVAAWREEEAKKRDVPRNRILRDESMIEIAHHKPASVSDLARTRGLGRRLAEGRSGEVILAAVKRGRAVADADCPQPVAKPELPRGLGPITDLLKVMLKLKCEEFDVAPKLIASSSDLDLIAAFGEDADVRAMHGWRREVFGNDALRLRGGEMALAIKNRRIQVVELNPQPAD